MITQRVATLGQRIEDTLEAAGRFTLFSLEAAAWMARDARSLRRIKLLMPQLYDIGTMSIPVVMIVGAFVGAVIGIESYDQFLAVGQEQRLGGVISISVLKQIGPVLAAMMIAGRVGGAVCAELGTMKVTEQIDALRVMGVDPVAYLVVPRVLACVLMMPVLTLFCDILGVFGGWVVVVRGYGVDNAAYWAFSRDFVGAFELFSGLGKATFFGLCIGLIACYKGFNCGPGASGVGKASTESFVATFISIIVSNVFIASFLKNLYVLLYGAGGPTAFG